MACFGEVTANARTNILPVYGFDSIRVSSERVETPDYTGQLARKIDPKDVTFGAIGL